MCEKRCNAPTAQNKVQNENSDNSPIAKVISVRAYIFRPAFGGKLGNESLIIVSEYSTFYLEEKQCAYHRLDYRNMELEV